MDAALAISAAAAFCGLPTATRWAPRQRLDAHAPSPLLPASPQVKSDAASPAEIKGTWNIWLSSEKAWKEGRNVKCVAVSATPGVYIIGPTPNSLLQDKLGAACLVMRPGLSSSLWVHSARTLSRSLACEYEPPRPVHAHCMRQASVCWSASMGLDPL